MKESKKVLFANPPTYNNTGNFNRPIRFPTYNYATPVLHPPLLLTYAASYIRSKGHNVEFIDAQVDSINVKNFISTVNNSSPDIIVLETSTPSFNNDVKVAEELKENIDKNIKIAFCGPHVSALPIESMKDNCLDAVIIGEYEQSLFEYIESGGNGTKGVCFRDENGDVILNNSREYLNNLDTLPLPARDLIPNNKYFDPILKNPFTFVLGGRGCPHKCIFCNWPQVMTGRRYRRRSPKNIAEELEIIEEKYNFKSFLFNDDTFTDYKNHVIDVCDEIIERGIKLQWGCYSRADLTDIATLKKLREAGCFLLKVGVESGDQQILDSVKKGYKIEEVVKGVNLMKDFGFHVHCTFVFGLPGETEETIIKTMKFAKKLDPTTAQFSTAVPYPGCEFYNYLNGRGLILTEDWDKYMPMNPIFEYPNLSAKDINEAVKKAYRNYYFRPNYLKKGLIQLYSNPSTVISNIRSLINTSFKSTRNYGKGGK